MPQLPKFPRQKKKLRATTARRSLGASTEMGYDESEPNMKLSRALLIVLVLHIVAVAGIIAFNAIKTRQASVVSQSPATPENSSTSSTIKPTATAKPAVAQKSVAPRDENKAAHSPPKAVAKDDHAKTTDKAAAGESGKTYVVAKGDNPVTIAKKLKVPYDDLIAINRIEDPRKLQIGQKLLIPSKNTKTKKTNE